MAVMGLSVVMLDYASQAAITPCESLVADMQQRDPLAAGGTDDGYFVYSSMLRYDVKKRGDSVVNFNTQSTPDKFPASERAWATSSVRLTGPGAPPCWGRARSAPPWPPSSWCSPRR